MKRCSSFWLAISIWLWSFSVFGQGPALDARPTASAAASAADVERAKESFKVGAAAYAAGEYLAAIQALEAAYALTPLPAIAFSLAQAERRQYFVSRRGEHLAAAISLFRRYVEQAPSGSRRADALDALAQLEPLAARSESTPAPSATPLASSEQRTRLMVISEAPWARIWIDGVELSGSPLIREVAPGKHRVLVRAPGFRDGEREVVAVSGELIPVSVPLAELPSRLEVTTPEDAEIFVDGAFVSEGGERVILELPSGSHRVSVGANGQKVASRVLVLERGGQSSTGFELEPTAQRITSHVLLIGGAAALGGGIALGALALSSENAAQQFVAEKEQGNVTNAELVRYDADVTRRNRYRLMAGASFGAALGLLITGLFLHELDKPGFEDLNRGGLGATAVVAPDHVGAGFTGAF
jgi:hypothetical protein